MFFVLSKIVNTYVPEEIVVVIRGANDKSVR